MIRNEHSYKSHLLPPILHLINMLPLQHVVPDDHQRRNRWRPCTQSSPLYLPHSIPYFLYIYCPKLTGRMPCALWYFTIIRLLNLMVQQVSYRMPRSTPIRSKLMFSCDDTAITNTKKPMSYDGNLPALKTGSRSMRGRMKCST